MPESNIPGVPVLAGSPPASGGAAPSAPVVDQAAITAAVAEALKPTISSEITGAVKRIVASEVTKALEAAKGNAPAPNEGDEAKPRKVDSAKVAADAAAAKAAQQDKTIATLLARANRGIVAEALSQKYGGQEFSDGAKKLLTKSILAAIGEDDKGNAYVREDGRDIPLAEYLAEQAKDPSLTRAAVVPGSGVTQPGNAVQPITPGQYKSKRELTKDKRVNAKGETVWEITPASSARFLQVRSTPEGRALIDSLPDV